MFRVRSQSARARTRSPAPTPRAARIREASRTHENTTTARCLRRGLLLAFLLPVVSASADPGALRPGESTPSRRVLLEDEWAALLLGRVGFGGQLTEALTPAERFTLLCVERAERSLGAGGRELPSEGLFRVVVDAPPRLREDGPIRTVVSVPATALYRLSVEGLGSQRWVVDQAAVAHLDPTPLGVGVARALVPLRRGPHEIAGYLPPSARVDRVELVAHRPLCAAPADGWHEGRPLLHGALARSLVRALGVERRLPERPGERIDIEGESFEEAAGAGGVTERRLARPASRGAWAAAISGPAEFRWHVTLAEPRVVSLEARTHGVLPQLWSIDGRHRVRLSPESAEAGFAWSHVLTLPLSAGRHVVRALLARGSGVDALRVVAHRSADSHYASVLAGLGAPTRAPQERVTRGDAERVLGHATIAALAASARSRLEGAGAGDPVVLVESAPDPAGWRSLSPTRPAEL